MSLYEIYEKIAAKNPAVPASASEQKAGDLNPKGVEANYMAGQKAGKQVAGDVKRSTAPGDGYVALNGAQSAGQQKGGFVNRHGAPDGGERGSTGPDSEALTKAAMKDKTMVGKGGADGRVKGRPHLKNQGVSGVFTLTKDASMRDLGVASGIKLAMDMEKAKKKAKKKADELKSKAKDKIERGAFKVQEGVRKATGFETEKDRYKRQSGDILKSTLKGGLAGAALGGAAGAGVPAHQFLSRNRWDTRHMGTWAGRDMKEKGLRGAGAGAAIGAGLGMIGGAAKGAYEDLNKLKRKKKEKKKK